MSRRSMLEQELYEQLIDQGLDEYSADLIAHEQSSELEAPSFDEPI